MASKLSAKSTVWLPNWNAEQPITARNAAMVRGKFEFACLCYGYTHSIESERSRAYSSDLRWRMVYQRSLLGLSYNQIASYLNVDPSTV